MLRLKMLILYRSPGITHISQYSIKLESTKRQYSAPTAGNSHNPATNGHQPSCSLPGIHHTELTLDMGKGGEGGGGDRKILTNRSKMCKKLLNLTTNNVPTTARLEHTSTMAKCTESVISYEYS